MRSLILILLLLPVGLSKGQSAPETNPQIQVTHTWGDLLKTKPLTIESDKVIYPDARQTEPGKPASVSVQVGIDRDHAAKNGAVLLYCVAKGVSFSRTSDHDLGPFQVRVQAPGFTTLTAAMTQLAAHAEDLHDSTYLLFTKSVPLSGTGNYVIELIQKFKPDAKTTPKVIAKIEVKVSGEPVLPWSPWDESDEEETLPQGADEHFVFMTVCNPQGGIAISKASEEEPILYQEIPAHETSLPQLIPDQPDPQYQLKLIDNTLVVTTAQDVLTDSPDDDFLTRWWVNDKPYVPSPDVARFQRARQSAAALLMANIKEVRFKLDFRPERLGAKKGDKIGVQVLYCPEGWQWCGGPLELMAMQDRVPSPLPTSFSFPSNRIDFIYSGDPKNLQQK